MQVVPSPIAQTVVPMEADQVPRSAAKRRIGGLWYARLPADPPPNELAHKLREANIHRTAAKRLDDYERMEAQAHEHNKARVRACLGMACVVLGTAPAIPGTLQACPTDPGWLCGMRIGAMVGAAVALGLSVWTAYELSQHPLRIDDHIRRLNDAIHRSLKSKRSDLGLDDLFSRYRHMSRAEKAAFKTLLHEHAQAPKHPVAPTTHTQEVIADAHHR